MQKVINMPTVMDEKIEFDILEQITRLDTSEIKNHFDKLDEVMSILTYSIQENYYYTDLQNTPTNFITFLKRLIADAVLDENQHANLESYIYDMDFRNYQL